MSRWSAILCGIIAIAAVWLIDDFTHQLPGPPDDKMVTRYNVQVLRTIDSYTYLMRDEDGTIFHAIFCPSFEPQFDGGMTLNMLRYQERADCWDIRQPNSYIIRRDEHGRALREHFDYANPERPAGTGAGRDAAAGQAAQSTGSH